MITFQEAIICWSGPLRSVNTIFRGRLPNCEMWVHRNQPFWLADRFCFLLGISTFFIVGVIALAVTIVAVVGVVAAAYFCFSILPNCWQYIDFQTLILYK